MTNTDGPENSTRALVVFARAPLLGRVKTRLAAELGDRAALDAYRMLGRLVVQQVTGVADCLTTIAYTPAGAEEATCAWLGDARAFEPQRDGDLGARMLGAIENRLAAGARAVVVIGTDCPDVDSAVVERAFAALGSNEVVVGPASDGGYYLIGMRQPLPALFDGVPWSSDATLAITLRNARVAGLRVALLETLSDIDTADDWRRWLARAPSRQASRSAE